MRAITLVVAMLLPSSASTITVPGRSTVNYLFTDPYGAPSVDPPYPSPYPGYFDDQLGLEPTDGTAAGLEFQVHDTASGVSFNVGPSTAASGSKAIGPDGKLWQFIVTTLPKDYGEQYSITIKNWGDPVDLLLNDTYFGAVPVDPPIGAPEPAAVWLFAAGLIAIIGRGLPGRAQALPWFRCSR